jgi:hypothetical protein
VAHENLAPPYLDRLVKLESGLDVWISESAEKRKTSSLTAERPAEDALLDGLPSGDLAGVLVVSLHAAVKLGNLFAGNWNVGWMGRQIVPKLADQKELLGRCQPTHVGNGFENHGWKIPAADGGTSSEGADEQ